MAQCVTGNFVLSILALVKFIVLFTFFFLGGTRCRVGSRLLLSSVCATREAGGVGMLFVVVVVVDYSGLILYCFWYFFFRELSNRSCDSVQR